jgi:putative NADPH-quinone reductase
LIQLKGHPDHVRHTDPMRITIIDGHPDRDPKRFGHALADTYAGAAREAGHEVTKLTLSELDVPLLHGRAEWERSATGAVAAWQAQIASADHLVLIYPLWLGDMPALVKAFLEQALRPGFAIAQGARTLSPGLLKGKSARVIVTMGMPALVYRWFFLAHSLRSLKRNILYFVGLRPVRTSLIGSIEGSAASRANWLARVAAFGRTGR